MRHLPTVLAVFARLVAVSLVVYAIIFISTQFRFPSRRHENTTTTELQESAPSTTLDCGADVVSHGGGSEQPLLCIFTTFRPDRYKQPLYTNTLHNWINLSTSSTTIRPILYLTNSTERSGALATLACHLGWTVLMSPKTSQLGVPYFKAMYADAAARFSSCDFYGFSNGDLLYTRGLVDTLIAVKKVRVGLNRTLVIGRRTNMPCCNVNELLYMSDDVAKQAEQTGRLFKTYAIDYFFIASNDFPWDQTKDLMIGRRGYDNYVVSKALRHGVSVVDATKTLLAVHQTDRDGIGAGRRSPHPHVNMMLIGKEKIGNGRTDCAQYYTKFTNTVRGRVAADIAVVRRAKI